jgi:hypothetical protein
VGDIADKKIIINKNSINNNNYFLFTSCNNVISGRCLVGVIKHA